MYSIGRCDRCGIEVSKRPGLGYADRRGWFSYCESCLSETGIGDRQSLARGKTMNDSWWLEDLLPKCDNPFFGTRTSRFLLGKAAYNWYRLKDVKCPGGCCTFNLKLYGKCTCGGN